MNKLIYDYLKKNNDFYPDSTYGDGYRCSVYLNDGTYLPCVMLRKSDPVTQLALQRFKQEKYGKSIFNSITKDGYEKIVKSFVTSGNHVNYYDIAKLEPSRFAVPLSLLKKVEGETTMAWTGFVFEMRDGKLISFGTPFKMEFLKIPENYNFNDVVAVHNHSYVSLSGELKPLIEGYIDEPTDYDRKLVNREMQYFICYYDRLF